MQKIWKNSAINTHKFSLDKTIVSILPHCLVCVSIYM